MKHEIIKLLREAEERLRRVDLHGSSALIGSLHLAARKLEEMRDVDPLSPINEKKEPSP